MMFKIKRNSSKRRKKILEVIRKSPNHPSADWIYDQVKKEIPGISLGTVYRNLKILEEEGDIHHIPVSNSMSRYDANLTEHHHITCEQCGKIMDIDLDLNKSLFDKIENEYGFKLTPQHLCFVGICRSCQNERQD